jgi:hypothetical protein
MQTVARPVRWRSGGLDATRVPGGTIRKALFVCAAFAAVLAGPSRAAEAELVGRSTAFKVTASLDARWKVTAKPGTNYVIFHFEDTLGGSTVEVRADIGVFRAVLPAAARTAPRAEILAAVVLNDALKIRRALLGRDVDLALAANTAETFRGGELWRFLEPDVVHRRPTETTERIEVLALFPPTFQRDGAIFVFVAHEKSEWPLRQAAALGKLRAILDGLGEP